ncbi:hypothetical protein BLNAU_18623 [Blattamonas nauphoetae]|uniref:t-SNARE coiled-coil homology domain-containing protein n=1 Tax=Blattamonas nauphoetae TaxID=2049346 RepID=A0ABQ9X4F4_9EUKA|nr:hypothetical protein BLNAU_18623 [Blattamonas nauphoetae]
MATPEGLTSTFSDIESKIDALLSSINKRNTDIENGTPRQQTIRIHNENKKNLQALEKTFQKAQMDYRACVLASELTPLQARNFSGQMEQFEQQINEAKQIITKHDGNEPIVGTSEVHGETEHTRQMTDQEMIENADRQIDRQNDLLDVHHTKMQRNIQKGQAISDTLDQQDKQIDRVNEKAVKETDRTNATTAKMKRISTKSALVLYIVLVVLILVFIIQMATKNFGLGFWDKK